jgi:uncharacterized HAD superfamily protein
VDKWNRPSWNDAGLPALQFEEIAELGFDFAVEDSLETAVRLVREFDIPVALIDRPWNRTAHRLPSSVRHRLVRCRSWEEVASRFSTDPGEPVGSTIA